MQEDINTRKGVERVIRFAFDYCERSQAMAAARVLMSDKSNVMTYAGGLWQRVFKEVSRRISGDQTQHMYVDALCMQMVRDPKSVRRDRHQQHVRRHHYRPCRRAAGRVWHGRQRQHSSRQDVDVRAGAWFRPADRGQEHGQSDRRDFDCIHVAGASGLCGGGEQSGRRGARSRQSRRKPRPILAEVWARGRRAIG